MSARLVALAAWALSSALFTTGSALAHISVTPGLVVVNETQVLSLAVHNDLDRPMTGLAVAVPSGLRIVGARTERAWQSAVENNTVTWSGGPLAPNTGDMFALDVAVDEATPPGPVQLQAEQLYPGGRKLPWPISVTVVPSEEESQLLVWAIVGAIVLVATAAIALIALQRRRTLQER